jgi:hypothetical protein
VAIVDASPGRPSRVRKVALSAGRELIDLAGTFDEVVAAGEAAGSAFLRAFVRTEGPVPGLAERVRDALPNAVDVSLVYERADAGGTAGPSLSTLQPRDQFVTYFRREHGVEEVPPDLIGAFDEVLAGVEMEG